MTDIQEIIKLLAPITLLITAIAGGLEAFSKSVETMEKLLSKSKPALRLLLLALTQIVPVGSIIWNFMYVAALDSERLTERVFFLLIVIYPTLLICAYEVFWGIGFYPRLYPASGDEQPAKSKAANRNRKNTKGNNL